jgi:regulator of replication initiation timing
MTKYTIQERFFLFTAITMVLAYCYQFYLLNEQDKEIDKALERNNKITVSYVEENRELHMENTLLRQALQHERAMYNGQTTYTVQLEQEINSFYDFHQREMIKVKKQMEELNK